MRKKKGDTASRNKTDGAANEPPATPPKVKRVELPPNAVTSCDSERLLREYGEAALNLLPGTKTFCQNSTDAWDSFLMHAHTSPELARTEMERMSTIMRGGVQSLHGWAWTAKHVPEVQAWAQRTLADMISFLEEFGFADLPRSPESYGHAFKKRWDSLHSDGRGPSSFAVAKLFAHELSCKSEAMLQEILKSYPESLPDDASPARKALWNFVDGCVKWRLKEGDKLVEEGAVKHMFDFFRRIDSCEEILWREHLWPLMQETWPEWIREPEREEFVGFGTVIFGLPLTTAKRKNGKLALEPSKWEDAVRGHIKRMGLFGRLFHGEGQ